MFDHDEWLDEEVVYQPLYHLGDHGEGAPRAYARYEAADEDAARYERENVRLNTNDEIEDRIWAEVLEVPVGEARELKLTVIH